MNGRPLTVVAILFLITTLPLVGTQGSGELSTDEMKQLAVTDLDAFAARITEEAETEYEQARAVTRWFAENFDWTATDYQKRTVEQIFERGGGNCAELARVTTATLEQLGLPMRQVREINLHVESERRQRSAEAKVAEAGARMSVFGRRHNDHVWIEIQNRSTEEWFPADPSLGVVGENEWLAARLGFEERFTLDPTSADMIAPFAIFAKEDSGGWLDRTRHYVVDGFNRLYGGQLETLPSWPRWVEGVEGLRGPALGAFRGEADLHQFNDQIAELSEVYEALRREAEEAGIGLEK